MPEEQSQAAESFGVFKTNPSSNQTLVPSWHGFNWSPASDRQVRSCDTCQRNNHKLQKASGSLKPIPVPTKLWSQVGMDLIGPLPATPRGNQYIVTLTDYFSKWAEAAPLPDKTAHGVARFIYAVSGVI